MPFAFAVQSQNTNTRQFSLSLSKPPLSQAMPQQQTLSPPEHRAASPSLSHKSSFSRKFLPKRSSQTSLKSNKTAKTPKQELSEAYDFVSGNSPPLPPSVMQLSVSKGSLGNRLQELALAHGDGLLDDEEYRELKQALFCKFSEDSSTKPKAVGLGLGISDQENVSLGLHSSELDNL